MMDEIAGFRDLGYNGLRVHSEKAEWSPDMFVLFTCYRSGGYVIGRKELSKFVFRDESDIIIALCRETWSPVIWTGRNISGRVNK